jgi:hypothetical protein
MELTHASLQQSSPLDWNEALDVINNATSAEKVVDGLKLVCPDSGALDDPTKDADLLVSTLFIKVGLNFVFHEALVLDGFLDLDFLPMIF